MGSLIALSAYFPELRMKSGCEKSLRVLGAEPHRYIGMTVFLSLALALLALVGGLLLKLPLVAMALPATLLAFALAFAFFLAVPDIELRKMAGEIEASMPFFLRGLGMLLEMGLPFQRAVGIASGGSGVLHGEMRIVLKEADEGASLQRALSSFAISFNSLVIKRAVSQMISVYETGASGAEMKKIGDELLSLEQHRLKEYAARSAMFGLLFILSSAILPTFFLVYAIAGSMAAGSRLEPQQIALAMLVVFPLVSVLILALSKATMPRTAFGRVPGSARNSGAGSSGFGSRVSGFGALDSRFGMLLPGAVFIAGFVLFPRFQTAAMGLGMITGAYFAYRTHIAERRLEEIDAALPDALFSVSGMPKSSRPERIFMVIEDGGFGALSEEAGKSRRQLEMNVKTAAVLDDLAARNPSEMLGRACHMMKQMMDTNSLDRVNSLAEDMIRSFQAKRERSQLFALQKYTLVFGAVLIPLILKMTLNLLQSMSGLLEDATISEAAAAAGSVVPPYLVIYAIVASMAIADAEGKGSAVAIYSVGLSVLGLFAFHFISF